MADEIQFCGFCSKPFAQASSYKRHVAYCRRAQNRAKKRPRSCKACNLAKAKCSFQTPCSRCIARKVECIYPTAPESNFMNAALSFDLEAFDFATLTEPLAFEHAVPDYLTDYDELFSLDNANRSGSTSIDLVARVFSTSTMWTVCKDSHPIKQLLHNSIVEASDPQRDMVLSLNQGLGDLGTKRGTCMSSQRSANIILQSFWNFPEQMLDRDNLPFFIHGKTSMFCEPLLACQRLCQTFVTRTPELLPFIWRCIRSEEEHFLKDPLNRNELLAAAQAQVVYIMMMISESGLRRIEWAQEMLNLSAAVCLRLASEIENLSRDVQYPLSDDAWDTWVFGESVKRKQCIWFVMTLLFNVQNGLACSDLNVLRNLHLPASKLQWEADSGPEWLQESYNPSEEGLQTIGDLLDSHKNIDQPFYARSLRSWSAKSDQLGSLLNLAVGML